MQRTAHAVKQDDLVEFMILGTGTFGKASPEPHFIRSPIPTPSTFGKVSPNPTPTPTPNPNK
eukprot:scaffold69598_cov36-Phaeocystis_antarctica.AAC.1